MRRTRVKCRVIAWVQGALLRTVPVALWATGSTDWSVVVARVRFAIVDHEQWRGRPAFDRGVVTY